MSSDRRGQQKRNPARDQRDRRTRLYPRRKHEGPLRILFIDVLDLWWRFVGQVTP